MSLRTVSSSRSAYGCFAFEVEFFDGYAVPAPAEGERAISCRVLAKVCMALYVRMPLFTL